MGCILSSLDKEAGRFSTKGEIGFIDVDPEIHCTRLASADEMKRVFQRGFYDDLKGAPGVHIAKFHKP
ncbi:hypothetical protein [Burkholderia phage FLC6]|nr:hypothetical protein [Burkholderia phage FLC6]